MVNNVLAGVFILSDKAHDLYQMVIYHPTIFLVLEEFRLTRQRGQDLLLRGGVEGDGLRYADILAEKRRPGSRKSLPKQRRARE